MQRTLDVCLRALNAQRFNTAHIEDAAVNDW